MRAPTRQPDRQRGSPAHSHARIAIFLHSLAGGGTERNLLMLARRFAERGHEVELVLRKASGPLETELPRNVRVLELGTPPLWRALPSLLQLPRDTRKALGRELWWGKPRIFRCLGPLSAYLRERRPDALLTSITTPALVALWARAHARVSTRVVVRETIHFSVEVGRGARAEYQPMTRLVRRWYPEAAAIVAVSSGVADDLAKTTGLARQAIHAIPNPIDPQRIAELAAQDPGDPWLAPGAPPLVLAVGRLVEQKDYDTLLGALARLLEEREARLLVLGEGPLRGRLEARAVALGIEHQVRFIGFADNPYAYMARAAVLALSSTWEGFPNVLLEALACGCRVVSTDCPSGPAEILANGEHGRLVPVGDAKALANALHNALKEPPRPERARARAAAFGLDEAADRYLELLLGKPGT